VRWDEVRTVKPKVRAAKKGEADISTGGQRFRLLVLIYTGA
jgi:hypothetical protein